MLDLRDEFRAPAYSRLCEDQNTDSCTFATYKGAAALVPRRWKAKAELAWAEYEKAAPGGV